MPRFALEGTSRPGLLGELMRRHLCQRLTEDPRALSFLFLIVLSAAQPRESMLPRARALVFFYVSF